MSLVEVRGLYKRYHSEELQVEVLHNLNFEMRTGEFVSIRGSSGAGKSTFLNILGGLDDYDEGSVNISGFDLKEIRLSDHIHEYRKKVTGLIFQHHYLMADFTIVENVMMPLLIQGVKRKEARDLARSILDQVGILKREGHYPSQVSGGESQRAAVARAVIGKPPLILADEPTGNLDAENRNKFINLLSRLQSDHNLSVVVVTHEEDLANAAETRYVMKDGTFFN